MFRLGLLVIIVACIVLAVTNPQVEAHKRVVYGKVPQQAGVGGLLGEVAGDILKNIDALPLTYNNYVLFSTTTFRDDVTSVGLLTKVWPTSRSD